MHISLGILDSVAKRSSHGGGFFVSLTQPGIFTPKYVVYLGTEEFTLPPVQELIFFSPIILGHVERLIGTLNNDTSMKFGYLKVFNFYHYAPERRLLRFCSSLQSHLYC